ncbi:MAG: asparagine synthase (glutamine-hydrolyzing) [Tissierellia bacterium]|nr:asparagine synthase (glutamine-hydrolyzing) [Tissierellia bacterium]
MCGFVGIVGKNELNEERISPIKKMAEAIAHRGPDDLSLVQDRRVVMGFCRLGIIDLSHRSNQPMVDEKTNTVLSFNGEIYNYKELRKELESLGHTFHTDSDTEVLLRGFLQWDRDVLSKLRGMFAFAIRRGERVFLARDPFGIKPLYYGRTEEGDLVFASEIKAFLFHPEMCPSVDEDLVFSFMELQHMVDERTMWKGVNRLPHGSFMEILWEDGQWKQEIHSYFQFDFKEEIFSLDEAVDQIQKTLMDSVHMHQRSDVKLGTFLSGGIDSSYITALTRPEVSFSIGFAEADGTYDESVYARDLSEILGVENRRRILDRKEVLEQLPSIIYALDEPQANLSSIPLYFLSEMARREVTVVLSGEGADELFGGYASYIDSPKLAQYKKLPYFVRASLRKLSRLLPAGTMQERLYKGGLPENESFVGEAHIASEKEVLNLLRHPYREGKRAVEEARKCFEGNSVLQGRQLVDLTMFMQKDILLKGDRMSMAHSLELRVPFLDKEVYRVARSLSDDLKTKGNITKYALRMAAKEILPEEWYNRPKKGFPVPMRYWLKEKEYYAHFYEVLSSAETEQYFNRTILIQMLKDHRDGRALHQRQLYAAYVMMVWIDQFLQRRNK